MKTYTQLIFESTDNVYNEFQGSAKRALFVCSAGLLRSPTAAKTAACALGWNTRSCGSNYEYALIPISLNLIKWADVIYFVNHENYDEVMNTFSPNMDVLNMLVAKSTVWDIPDNYRYDQPTLRAAVLELLA